MNRKADLNLLVHAATESIQQWARDIKGMRMGMLVVIHSFGADMKWHPHINPVEFPNEKPIQQGGHDRYGLWPQS